ncbi:hypothetical protein OR1_03644 [Geobacter sp. OR-1]|uniref:DUF6166 domain-containing protein n=1 Tax=Geobacter sp. OR-1 TaxID=1266765 RepID=UPI000541D04A|nr:DUF6166 domain-containing protein [Geobacter sp. OR-1]GAM11331.1 hypothetical protein OR1_03644 [Geobacter sp. OR-1]
MKIIGNAGNCDVFVDGEVLHPDHSLALRIHSPAGFNWGYNGSGSASVPHKQKGVPRLLLKRLCR